LSAFSTTAQKEKKLKPFFFLLPKEPGTVASIPQQAKDYTCSDMQLASKLIPVLPFAFAHRVERGRVKGTKSLSVCRDLRARVIVRDPIDRDDDS